MLIPGVYHHMAHTIEPIAIPSSPHLSEPITTLFTRHTRVHHCMSTIHLLKFITTMPTPHYLDSVTITPTFHFVMDVTICVHIISWGSSQSLLICIPRWYHCGLYIPLPAAHQLTVHTLLPEPILCYPDTFCFIEPVRKKKSLYCSITSQRET